ncbi:MAG: sigma-54-dependent Fis family transcriptional regulator [Candidatus Krumholzibacteriota bacterium]|uniref:Sigma-54-dependent Fis family transcriptional regulator n=1 Tax=Eiseniibacteriota bacterium TaxID=2212470 RepID=A0A7V2AV79_UNCEI|nr:sigma-54-dependent Fis family transcriptional regulator [Candidatus Krumholzibacteriota bacterium]HER43806.1 sigma-54-dependent Fis family transcriptional regulator [Candidatus Eisenbacteria bacterium]
MKPVILLVDDEDTIRLFLEKTLREEGYEALTAATGEEALELAWKELPDLVLLDLKLPDMSGIDVLGRIKESVPEIGVIMLTAFGDIETAVSAIKKGAFDFVSKPVNLEQLLLTLEKGLAAQKLTREVMQLRRRLKIDADDSYIPGESAQMREIYDVVKTVARSDTTTVLIQGESGTGKEMIANMIHRYSPRHDKPFLEINCASLPEELLESELFGHEKGAFTDARTQKIGLLELANKGTLFLDEIGEMSLTIQVKLLRVLEKMSFRRVGGTRDIKVSVRIISATNRDLNQAVREKAFREDLFYRLKVIPIHVPPLRDRKDDIDPLVRHFLTRFNRQFNKKFREVSDEAFAVIMAYPWPGNIRELKNMIERIVLLEDDEILRPEHLPGGIREGAPEAGTRVTGALEIALARAFPEDGIAFEELVKNIERELIEKAMRESNGNQSGASRLLGLNRDKLRYRLKQYGLDGGEEER